MAGSHNHRIAPGLRGWLESPRVGDPLSEGITVSGWAFAEDAPIVEVWAVLAGGSHPLQSGVRRDDVAAVYARPRHARNCGFCGRLEVGADAAARTTLEIWGRTADGRTVRLFSRRRARPSPVRRLARRWLSAGRRGWRSWRDPDADNPEALAARARAEASRAALDHFLASRRRLGFRVHASPLVSAIVVVWNRADLLLGCLQALQAQVDVDTEIVIVDNASTDRTPALLERIDGARLVRNRTNVGFTLGANLGARAARGEYLLFVNSDAEPAPTAARHLVQSARPAGVGAVGGKLVFPDGRLQEAGSIIWSDGSCEGYGRGDDPDAPPFNFERPVDFCSAALLITRRAVFERVRGFDERYRPGYYEDADYCVRLWSQGLSILYQPMAVALHHEFGSALSSREPIRAQRSRHALFASCHASWLASQPARDDASVWTARSHPYTGPVALIVDDAPPDPRQGAGFPRAAALLRALIDFGYQITIYATGAPRPGSPNALFPGVEVVADGPAGLGAFLRSRLSRRAAMPLVIVSRPHNMRYVKAAVGDDLARLEARWVYDAEAIYAHREIGRRRLAGEPCTDEEVAGLVDEELQLARGAATILAVNDADRKAFAASGRAEAIVVGHAVEGSPTLTPPERRRSILFVGSFSGDSPNVDAALFLCQRIRPALGGTSAATAPIVVAGAAIPGHLPSLGGDGVSWHSDVADLVPYYEQARVFVAPTRYSAGIPLKILEAAAQGVPIVSTPLVAAQLGWTPGCDLLTATSPGEFADAIDRLFREPDLWRRLREASLARVAREHSPEVFRAALVRALATADPAGRAAPADRPARAPAGAAGADSIRPGRRPPAR